MHGLIGVDLIKSLRVKEFKRKFSMRSSSNFEEKNIIIDFNWISLELSQETIKSVSKSNL